MQKANSRIAIFAWCLYDSAAASFSVIITTFIFATYFTKAIAVDHITGTYQWANAISIAGLVIALASPLFGAIADHAGHHKRWLFVFTMLAIISAAGLWFSYPTVTSLYPTLILVSLGTIGLEIALVFYNAFLPFIASSHNLGRISGWGWGCGYLGGIVALSLVLVWFVQYPPAWLDTKSAAQIRICGPFVAVWYLILSLPLFFWVPDVSVHSKPLSQSIRAGLRELGATLSRLPREKNILIYLIAHMIYADGLNTLFAFGGIYAAGTFGLSFTEVLLFGISMNITAGLGAILLGWMDDRLGSKHTILVSLFFLISFGVPLLLLRDKTFFWATALILCIFVGPVQSASRSLMARLIAKKESATEMFGLYALSGRVTAFMGPWLLGWLTLIFASQRAGMAVVLVFFLAGGILLTRVKETSISTCNVE